MVEENNQLQPNLDLNSTFLDAKRVICKNTKRRILSVLEKICLQPNWAAIFEALHCIVALVCKSTTGWLIRPHCCSMNITCYTSLLSSSFHHHVRWFIWYWWRCVLKLSGLIWVSDSGTRFPWKRRPDSVRTTRPGWRVPQWIGWEWNSWG